MVPYWLKSVSTLDFYTKLCTYIEKIFQNLYILPFVTIRRWASLSSPQTLVISYLNMNENYMLNCIKCIILNYIKSIINSF